MSYFRFDDLPTKEIIPGFQARLIHTEQQTISLVETQAGSILPAHSHVHEQVSQVLQGEFEMTVEGETRVCKKGDVVVIPSNAVHSGRALTDCLILDTFTPVREDYL
jgi:quercetin dioxygenase-like cupin family protein